VTPETQERNPFVAVATLVVLLALVAGLAARYGVNNVVAVICVGIAIVGTWLLLSPQVERLESAGAGVGTVPRSNGPQESATGTVSALTSVAPEKNGRQRLRSQPRTAVGFEADNDGARSGGPMSLPNDDDLFAESAMQVQALGQLPQNAQTTRVESTVDPAATISGAYTLGRFEVRAASRRGSDHTILNESRQDDYVVAQAGNGRYLVVVVADGQGAAENAHFGSYWATRLLAQTIDLHLREGVPGIEQMLSRTRDEVSALFDQRFTDGTKMRSIATTLVGLIAPVDGGPAAGFRVGDSDILIDGPTGWTSVFGPTTTDMAEAVFPRTIDAEVAPLNFDVNCLLLATDGVSEPIATNEVVAGAYSRALTAPISEVEFDQLMSFPLEAARGDRTAVAVWFTPSPS